MADMLTSHESRTRLIYLGSTTIDNLLAASPELGLGEALGMLNMA